MYISQQCVGHNYMYMYMYMYIVVRTTDGVSFSFFTQKRGTK